MDSSPTIRYGLIALLLICHSGCRTTSPPHSEASPQNIWKTENLPAAFRSVAVAPVKVLLPQESRCESDYWQRKTETLLLSELARTEKFAVFLVSPPPPLNLGLGISAPLPTEWFEWLRQSVRADGLLLTELSVQRHQPPFQTYWKLRLLDLRSGEFIWAADHLAENLPIPDGRPLANLSFTRPPTVPMTAAQLSPDSFLQYHLARLLHTLPNHPTTKSQENSGSITASSLSARHIQFPEPTSSTLVPPTTSAP